MYLLVIGLVAVIIAILVAAFLTLRRRPADDDEEADSRLSVRDRVRGRGRDDGWDSTPRRPGGRTMAGGRPVVSRRPGPDPRGSRRPGGDYEAADYDQDRGYEPAAHEYGERSPLGGYEPERVPAARRAGRHPEGTAPAARPARVAGGPATDYGTSPAAALYDTGPGAAADLTATQINAELDLADSDVFPRVRADIPHPASKPGKPSKQRNQPKSRGKASRKHDEDEDDWPSTEWDKLSDVEYWAELSADKPLTTTARTAQSAAPAQPAAAAARPAAGRPATPQVPVEFPDDTGGGARPAPRRPPAPARAPDSRPEGAGRPDARPRNTRPPASREPSPQRQDIQPASAQHTDPHAADPTERFTAWREQPDMTDRIPVRDRPRRPAAYPDDDPLTSPSFSRVSAPAEDSRSYRSADRGHSLNDGSPAGGYPRSPGSGGYPSGPAQPDSYPDPATGRRDYPAPGAPAGYPPLGDRTDPHGPRTDPHGVRTGPHSARPAASPPAGGGRRRAEAPAPQQAAASNPYGSFVESAPPPPPAGHRRNGTGSASTGSATTGPQYPPTQPPPSGNYPGYGTAPATAYPDPYGPPSGGYPAASAGPEQGTGWYAAPPAPTAAQPAGEYPYPGTPSGYPGSNGYLAQPSPAGYGSTYGNGSDGGQYSGGHRGDPYGRDDYGGYHPGQG
jgi:hypothetical protein